MHLRSLEDADPFEKIPEENIYLQEFPLLSIYPDNSNEDEDIITD